MTIAEIIDALEDIGDEIRGHDTTEYGQYAAERAIQDIGDAIGWLMDVIDEEA